MWDDAKALSALAFTLSAMAVVALFAASVHRLASQPAFAIREVVVTTKLVRTSAPHLEAIVREELVGTFFTINLDRARASIVQLPWVRTVALRRHWPPSLEIAIEEHAPLARFGNDGLLVNTAGETFAASHAAPLPLFSGPDILAGEMTARYREWTALLAPLALEVNELVLSARGGWRVRASGAAGPLTIEIGRDDPDARMKRFASAYARTVGTLARQGTQIQHVDLRYRNGFAARVPGFREGAPRKAT